jgi:hypothetical protein
MRTRLNDGRAARDLVLFLRDRDYLAVEVADGIVEAVPIQSVGDELDRTRTLADVDIWLATRPGVVATPDQ